MPDWISFQTLAILASGFAVQTGATKAFDWWRRSWWTNSIPSSGEPMIYIRPLGQRLPNGQLLEITIRNTTSRDVWIGDVAPVSRAGGRIRVLPNDALTPKGKYVVDEPDKANALIDSRLEPEAQKVILAWVAGQDWPIWHFRLGFTWSPYGDAARPLSIHIHCKL